MDKKILKSQTPSAVDTLYPHEMEKIIYFKEKKATKICLFTLLSTFKKIISFFAIWPAALVVHQLQGQKGYHISLKNLKNPYTFCKHRLLTAWRPKGYTYRLESINLATKKANLYLKGARRILSLPLQHLVFNDWIINSSTARDSAHIGYYYGVLERRGEIKHVIGLERMQILKRGNLNIASIRRDGKLTIEGVDGQIVLSKKPMELYKNKPILDKFSPSQAFYIGYLASISHPKEPRHQVNTRESVPKSETLR